MDFLYAGPGDAAITVHWLGDGDHGFRPRKASGRTDRENLNDAADAVAAFAKTG